MPHLETEQLNRVLNLLKGSPTKRFPTTTVYSKVGNPQRITTAVLRKIREGQVPDVHWSQCKPPHGRGLRYEYFYIPEDYFPDAKVVTYRELLESGYLQEANRQFFHPLGLSLALTKDPEALIVYDFRDKPYGASFSSSVTTSDKYAERAGNVAFETAARLLARQKVLGYGVQDVTTNKLKGKLAKVSRK